MKKKDEFMSVASHELKTPITSMKASLQIVKRLTQTGKMQPQVDIFIDKANRQAEKLSELVSDLLDVTYLHAGKMQFNQSEFKISEAINESVEQIITTDSKHRLEIEGDAEVTVYADKHHAVKYSPDADLIKIRLSTNKKIIRVEICDFGIGIAQDKTHYVFDRFFRVQESSQKFSGLGLGLYISAQIIERHNGKVGVVSELGKGSTFWFTLPLIRMEIDNGN